MDFEKVKKENKRLKFFTIILSILLLITLVITWSSKFYYSSPEIDYSKLNNESKEYAESLVDSIKPEYLNSSRKITFTNDLNDLRGGIAEKILFKSNKGFVKVGTNWEVRKNIKVYLTGIKEYDLNTLQHELLHSLVDNFQMEEFYVDDMANKNVALKNGN